MSIQVKIWQVKHPWNAGDCVQWNSKSRGMYMFCLLADAIIYCCTLAIAHVVGGVSAFLDCFSELCFKVGLSSSSVSEKATICG